MTASASRKCGVSSSAATSAATHLVFGTSSCGRRRAMPTTDSTSESAASAASTLVPTFPLSPTTTIRMRIAYPEPLCGNDAAGQPLGALPAVGPADLGLLQPAVLAHAERYEHAQDAAGPGQHLPQGSAQTATDRQGAGG